MNTKATTFAAITALLVFSVIAVSELSTAEAKNEPEPDFEAKLQGFQQTVPTEKGTELSMKTQTSFSVETYANFEFPQYTEDEKFDVYVNGEPKEFIQSIDEMNNWHVAFLVEPRESGEILITGFAEEWDPGEGILIPDWVKFNSGWWAEGEIDDKNFARGLEFMIQEEIITISNTQNITNETDSIPQWVRYNALWWSNDLIDDETFVVTIQYLIEQGIIKI